MREEPGLLDFVRRTRDAAKEKGGITQHLSAYEVDSVHGKIVFLDTPGHEAFSYMRKKGTSVTDLVVLIVAADDGVMPQTVEVINHAKATGVPILVAINKIDKVDRASAVEKVKRQLAQYDLLPEDWGGDVVCVPISASTGEGVEELLEMIVLQSQMMDLKSDPSAKGKGFILEAKQEKGFGSVATVVCLNGTINVGDHFVCGSSVGKVRLLVNSHGERVTSAGPSIPVQVVGFDTFVSLGDWLKVVSEKEYFKERGVRKRGFAPKKEAFGLSQEGENAIKIIPIMVKTDTHGSQEAVLGVIEKINKTNPDVACRLQVIGGSVGSISEGDVEFASETKAKILGLHVKAEKNSALLAREQVVDIVLFDIIYKMAEYLEKFLKDSEEEIVVLKKTGEAVVKKIFDLKKRGTIAGCYISDGKCTSNSVVACIRDGIEVGKGKIVSLQKERKSVKEVITGQECGFLTDSFLSTRSRLRAEAERRCQ